MILRYEDIQQCLTQSLRFCELQLPIYPINLSRLCIVSIFMNEKEGVDKHCQTIVRVNQLLPHSSYIADGFYAIATNKPIQLTQACKQLSASLITVKAPLDIIQLKPSCSMTHRNLILPAYYYKLWPMLKFFKVGQRSQSRSHFHHGKGLVIRNSHSHVKYESPMS